MSSDHPPVTDYYVGSDQPPDSRVLLSYLTEPFRLDPDAPEFYSRQDRWQTMAIARAFNDLGYVVDVCRYDDPDGAPRPLEEYDVLFGFEPNFESFAAEMSGDVTKIYYAIGAHWQFRNPAEHRRLDRLADRRGSRIDPERTLPESEAPAMADAIIVTGDHYLGDDEFIADTYRTAIGSTPIYHVRISCFDFLDCGIEDTDFETARNNFLWFGGSGSVLKGLDLALEAFSEFDDKHLYVCGPVTDNQAFVDLYETELHETPNIHLMGYVNVTSETFAELTQNCAYVLNPSASGVAIPGALITCMHSGVIPIFTTEFEAPAVDWGVQLPDTEIETIINTVEDAAARSPADCEAMARRACTYAQSNHTRETYSSDLRTALRSTLS